MNTSAVIETFNMVDDNDQMLADEVREFAQKLFRVLPADFNAEGIFFRHHKSNVGESSFLVWERDEHSVYLEEKAVARDDDGRYLHGDFHAWIPAPSFDDIRAFARAVEGGLLTRVLAAYRARSSEDSRLAGVIRNATI